MIFDDLFGKRIIEIKLNRTKHSKIINKNQLKTPIKPTDMNKLV